jgi:MerR family transcriptional regulator, light-induced transcriptional regulator
MDNISEALDPALPTGEISLSISAVERDTGLSKDTLRMWERRYGFPQPSRDANGERAYPLIQVKKLQLVKRLMDAGLRPGKIISRSLEDLTHMSARGTHAGEPRSEVGAYLDLLRSGELAELRRRLSQNLMKQGLGEFVMATVAPLNRAVGEAWMQGDLAVFEEHLYTEQVAALLRTALASTQWPGQRPRVLLTTFPGELHALGLLMVEALLAIEGAACAPLGTETPLAEIARAARTHRSDVVGLSFSAAFNEKHAAAGLAELRAMLPVSIEMWAGGAAAARIRKPVAGVEVVASLPAIAERVKQWRAANPARTAAPSR